MTLLRYTDLMKKVKVLKHLEKKRKKNILVGIPGAQKFSWYTRGAKLWARRMEGFSPGRGA